MASHIGKKRFQGLPDPVGKDLIAMRHNPGLSQADLGRRVGLPQVHISGIETGKAVRGSILCSNWCGCSNMISCQYHGLWRLPSRRRSATSTTATTGTSLRASVRYMRAMKKVAGAMIPETRKSQVGPLCRHRCRIGIIKPTGNRGILAFEQDCVDDQRSTLRLLKTAAIAE